MRFKYKLLVLVFLITLLAVFFRTYRYYDRISLGADNSRDAQVAVFGKDHLQIPLTGNFSSAGPFFYGPWWYWFLEFTSFLPLGNLTLWYVSSALSFIFIVLIAKIGYELGGKLLAIVAAFFASVSTLQVENSLTIWNPSVIPVLAALSIYFAQRSLANRKLGNLFCLGFFVGLASTVHLQGVLTTPLIAVTLLFIYIKVKSLRKIALSLVIATLGFVVPFVPLIYFDLNHYFTNSTSFLVYFFVDQYRIWVPNRWLIYLFDYWPKTFAQVVGGHQIISYLLVILIAAKSFFALKNFKRHLPFFLLTMTLALEVLVFRYYRGERHTYITFFTHPFLILLTAWIVTELIRKFRYLGLFVLALVTLATAIQTTLSLIPARITYPMLINFKNEIYAAHPQQKFDLWHCPYNGATLGHPTAYLMYMDKRENPNGLKVGVCEGPGGLSWSQLKRKDIMEDVNWVHVSTRHVYQTTALWWQQKPPRKGEGNLIKFIMDARLRE